MAVVSLPGGIVSIEWTPPPRATWASRSSYSNKATIIDRGGVTQGWRAAVAFAPRKSPAEFRLFGALIKGAVNTVQLAASEDQAACPLATATVLGDGRVGNLLTYSEQFDNSAWAKFNTATVTANTTVDPNGATTADTFTFPAASVAFIRQQAAAALLPSTTYTFSVWLKGTAGQTVALQLQSSGTGLSSVSAYRTITASWARYSFTATTGGSVTGVMESIISQGLSGTATSFQGWGAQLETGAAPGPYIATITAAASSYESFRIGGLTSGVTYLAGGQVISLKGRLHTLTAAIIGAADGSATVAIDPALPALTTTGDVVALRAPVCTMRLVGAVPNWTATPGRIYTPADMQLEEVIA